jgi:uncharacterized protein
VRTVTIPAPVDLRLAQLSDVHLGSVGGDFFRQVVQKTNALKPDAVLITGDLVDNNSQKVRAAVKLLDQFEAPVFFISGNHEGYVGLPTVANMLGATKTRWLRNETIDFRGIKIVGLNDRFDGHYVAETLPALAPAPSAFAVLMYHRPEGWDDARLLGIDLMLSGHTHDGQIFPFNLLIRLIYPCHGGLYQKDGTYLNVCTGTGTWGPRMRLGTDSEVVLIQLRKNP